MSDTTMWLGPAGRLFVKDPLPPATGSPATAAATAAPAFPYDQTFLLHSDPGAQRTIYLDFDGEVVSDTVWNTSYGLSTDPQPPFDIDGNPAHWSNTELDLVQSVFQRVAEDFAPFAVDVTTAQPDPAALNRSSGSDQVYGTRVLITPSTEAAGLICNNACGGVAYIGVFDDVSNTTYEPAWVFPQLLSESAKNIAEAVTHEAGHNLGLQHDGTASDTYYAGQADWAPIMGVGYYKPLVQWSQGEYTGANNTEDDLAIISSHGLPTMPDDYGSTIATATPLTTRSVTGLISTRADADVFAVSHHCSTPLTATVTPAAVSPDLDASLQILASDGSVLAQDDPPSATVSVDQASGLGAAATVSASAGIYYVRVDGVGLGNPASGYSDYASLGRYTLTVTSCPTPTTPLNVVVTKNDSARTATISWDAPADAGDSPVTGYQVTRSGRSVTGAGPQTTLTAAGTRSVTFADLGADSLYRLTVAAVNDNGTSSVAGGTVHLRPGNLLVNGGFEADRDRNGRPDGWAAGPAFTRSSVRHHQGHFAARHYSTRNATVVARQSVPFLLGGSRYRFGGFIDIPRTTDQLGYVIQIRWLDRRGSLLRTDRVRQWTHGTGGWVTVKRRLTSPVGTTRAEVQLVATSLKGSVYVDGLLLRRRWG